MGPSDEIKAKINIVDLLREYMQLTAAGLNFKARCPFHREKSASFMVSSEKQIWHCFGCGKGGDIFAFIQEIEGVDFVGALKILAPKAGVALKRQDPKLATKKNKVLDIIDISRRYYNSLLMKDEVASGAKAYLKGRGLNDETIEEWQIGCSPDEWDGLLKVLKKRGYSDEDIFESGMSVKSQRGPNYYDRFRARIMFPIADASGSVIAFSARIRPDKEAEEKMGKYINSPQTILYDKSRVLFGLDKARLSIKKIGYAIIVEGQMDVIQAHQAGFKNVVASSGTALTGEQISLLKRYTNNIMLSFDMDNAGAMAADRGIREALKQEMNIKVITLPEGKDPDDCIRENKELFAEAVRSAKPMMAYYFEKIIAGANIKDPVGRREAAKSIINMIAKIADRIEQDYWIKELAQKIDVDESLVRETLRGAKESPGRRKPDSVVKSRETPLKGPKSMGEKISELILALIFKSPHTLDPVMNQLPAEALYGDVMQELYKNLLFYYNNYAKESLEFKRFEELGNISLDYKEFRDWLIRETGSDTSGDISENKNEMRESSQLGLLDKLVILGDSEYFEHSSEDASKESRRLINMIMELYLGARLYDLEKGIAAAEKEGDIDKVNALLDEFRSVSEEKKNYKNE